MSSRGHFPTVLFIANNFPPVLGGSAVVYENLARHAGGDIQVLAPRRSYLNGLQLIGWREHDRRAPYRVLRLDLLRTVIRDSSESGVWSRMRFLAGDIWIRARLAAAVLRLLRQGLIQTVCVGELLSSGWLLALLRQLIRLGLRLRLVVYVHGEEITTHDPYDLDQRRRRAALECADYVVVVSGFTLAVVHDLLGPGSEARTCLIENGVDTDRFQPGGRRPDLVMQYRLTGCFVFISVCRLLEKKGVDNAIRAFATLRSERAESRYLIVGAGPFEVDLRRIALEEGVGETVIFTGQVTDDELVAHYRLGDVFVMPNRELANGDTEGFGLVFLEANSCGLPVIAGRDGGSTNAVRDGENGLVVDGRSVEAIANAMERLHQDAVLRQKLIAEGLLVAAAAGWKAKSRRFLELSQDVRPT